MGKNKGPDLPAAPTFQADPTAAAGIPDLLKYGQELASGDFGGRLSWLNPTINNNNSSNSLAYAQALLQPQLRDNLTQITNAAAANGSLNSSTFTDALAKSNSDVNSQYQAILAQQAIADSNQSNTNRLALFGQGLDTIQNASQLGLGNQSQTNDFNLQNYNNQVAAALAGQKQSNGGFAGALSGGLGGVMAGLALAPLTGGSSLLLAGLGGAAGAAAGGLSPASSNMGGSLLGSGAGLLGSSLASSPLKASKLGFSAPSSGAFASNNPFGNSNYEYGYSNSAWNPGGAMNYFN